MKSSFIKLPFSMFLIAVCVSLIFIACDDDTSDDEIRDMRDSEEIYRYTIDLTENDSLLKSTGTYLTEDPELGVDGPVVVSVSAVGTSIPGGTVKLKMTFDRHTDHAIVNLKEDKGYYRFAVNGTSAEVDIHFSYKLQSALQTEFDNGFDQYCNDGKFQIPEYLEGLERYSDFFEGLGVTTNLLCSGDRFIGSDYISDKDLSTFLPVRVEQFLQVRGETNGQTGEVKEAGVQIQYVTVGSSQVSLWFDQYTDMDLHVKEPDGTEIYYGNTSSDSNGFLDLDSNPACSIDKVNNENIYWQKAPSGQSSVILHYWKACTDKPVNWIVSVRKENTLSVYGGTMKESNEDEYWKIADFDSK